MDRFDKLVEIRAICRIMVGEMAELMSETRQTISNLENNKVRKESTMHHYELTLLSEAKKRGFIITEDNEIFSIYYHKEL